MPQKSNGAKPPAHALRLDLGSIAQGGLAMLIAFTVAYLVING